MEEKVIHFLTKQGYCIVAKNFRCSYGEIDIISRKEDCLIFTEVKYRKSSRYGLPSEAVDKQKQRTLSKVGSVYCYQNQYRGRCRFDVVSVTPSGIEIIENAFGYRGRWEY